MERTKCLIIGSGPAGYTAAIYAGRANLSPVLYCGMQMGGQLTTTTVVENFPGYPDGVDANQMMMDLQQQARRFGADIRDGVITKADLSKRPFTLTTDRGDELQADSVIIATGASAKYLGLPDEEKYKGDFTAYVNDLYDKSLLMKDNTPIYINKKSYAKDLGVLFGQDLIETMGAIRADLSGSADQIEEQEKWLCAAKLRMEQDLPNYSDANFTLRMTYGQVGEYTLGGKPSGYYTDARSLWEKMQRANDNFEYFAEPVMHELLSAKDFGAYADKETGTLQLCFLSNNDITGGNSGSPIFNGKGELLGLAFDGNWDSLSSDIFFDKQLARTINVDVRYMLYMMDRWGHADRLLKEIGIKK